MCMVCPKVMLPLKTEIASVPETKTQPLSFIFFYLLIDHSRLLGSPDRIYAGIPWKWVCSQSSWPLGQQS